MGAKSELRRGARRHGAIIIEGKDGVDVLVNVRAEIIALSLDKTEYYVMRACQATSSGPNFVFTRSRVEFQCKNTSGCNSPNLILILILHDEFCIVRVHTMLLATNTRSQCHRPAGPPFPVYILILDWPH